MKKELDLAMSTRLINHGPLVMISSMHGEKVNITPVAWHMPVSKKPPMIALEIGEGHFIFECIMRTGDFAVNILPVPFSKEIVYCGTVSGRDTDKIKHCGFNLHASKEIKSPGISESLAVMECVVIRDNYLMEEYNIVLGEVKRAVAEEGAFDGHWMFSEERFRTIHHLGDKTFCAPSGGLIDLRQEEVSDV